MAITYVGAPIRRVEDARFLTGRGCYTDDLRLDGECHAALVRSPHPHARILEVDAAEARSMPGVRLVLTGADVEAVLAPIPSMIGIDPETLRDRNANRLPAPPQRVLAVDKVRMVGDAVAFVVAETREAAKDAAERVRVDYEPLSPVIDFDDALDEHAPLVWEELASNVSFEWEGGDRAATDAAFERAAHVVEVELLNPRQVVAFMEPRNVLASFDPGTGRFTVRAGAQSAHAVRNVLAAVLGADVDRIRVIVPDTGGGFGARNNLYPEFALAAHAARELGRPVRWTADRTESFLTDSQARDQRVVAALALDANGDFKALRTRILWRHGALLPTRSLWVYITFTGLMLSGAYRLPAVHHEMRGLFTNTAPVHAFRGVGRAEAAFLVERLVEETARALGRDPVELRRQNLIPAEAMPYQTATGAEYGRCEFEKAMDQALEAAQWRSFAARREASRRAGRLRGIGLSVYVEATGGAPSEFAEVAVSEEGLVHAYLGTKSFGMGHETVFAQVLADELGIGLDRIRIIDGDTDRVKSGFGSHGSRSMRIGGGALVHGTRKLIERGLALAAEALEAPLEDLEYGGGRFAIKGTDRGIDLFELAKTCAPRGETLAGEAVFDTHNHAYASGAHVCELEVDPETGEVRVLGYVMVCDAGRVINPLLAEGQLHGAVVQGLGQALLEDVRYDPQSGQTLSASFMDYAIPRADDLPDLAARFSEVLCEDNPLGVKGAGEGPTIGCPPAVMNALRDALSEAGDVRLDMPATPHRVWQALRAARS